MRREMGECREMTSTAATHEPDLRSTGRGWTASLSVFFLTFVAFLLLRSHDLSAVDGAIRAFDVYRHPRLILHPNSHMLYPVFVLWWKQALELVGFRTGDPLEFIRLVQAMNALFAAGCAAALAGIVRSLTSSTRIAIGAGLAWAFSHAVLLHATNSAEPMSGMFFSTAAFALAVRAERRSSQWLLVPVGLSLAVAMGSYQSTVFLGLACGLLTFLWPGRRVADGSKRATELTGSFVVGLVGVFGGAYWLRGARSVHEMWQLFTTVEAGQVYGAFKLSKLVNVVPGYVDAFVVALPHNYGGLRWLVGRHDFWIAWFAVCALAVFGISFVLVWKARGEPRSAVRRAVCLSAAGSLLLGILVLCYWEPTYDKLWLQPLWIVCLMGGLSWPIGMAGRVRTISWMAIGVLVLAGGVNLAAARRASVGRWPNVEEARRVSAFVKPGDLVVVDWSTVGMLYRQIWAGDELSYDFVSEVGVDRDRGVTEMNRRVEETLSRGGSVYFLGLLDLDPQAWDGFLRARCGVPYGTLEKYRRGTTAVARFQGADRTVTLWRYVP